MNADDFLFYDRITDTMMFLSNNITLDFVVSLSYKRRDGNRQFFHSEFDKTSSYRLTDISKTIRRSCRYYYAINIKDNFGGGLILRHSDVYILTTTIETQVLPWFFQKRIFKVVDDKLAIVGQYQQYMYPQSETQYLSIAPIVYEYEGGQFKEGVRMFINSADQFVDMTLDNFLGFFHLLKTTDMYVLASTMMNYAKTPPYDVNAATMQPGLGSGGGRREQAFERPMEDIEQRGRYTERQTGLGANNFLNNSKTSKGE